MPQHFEHPPGSAWRQVFDSAKLVIYSTDKKCRLLILERNDGNFHVVEEILNFDDDTTYWVAMQTLRGVYDSVATAEREARTWPHYRGA